MSTTHCLIPRLSFCRLVKSIMDTLKPGSDFRFQRAAIDCLQEASEVYVTGVLSDANLIALHANRVTLMPRDLTLLLRLRNNH